MDIVYVVGPGDHNPELRYSLRSLENLDVSRVWVVGHRPPWLTGVTHIPVPQAGSKHANTWENWRAIAAHGPESFVLFNDDFFVTAPIGAVGRWHRGGLDANIARLSARPGMTRWAARATATRDALTRLGRDPQELAWWELHVPLPMRRDLLAAAVADLDAVADRDPGDYCKRTWYAGHAALTGTERLDCKVHDRRGVDLTGELYSPWLSTSDLAWRGQVGQHIRARWPSPGRYETEAADVVAA